MRNDDPPRDQATTPNLLTGEGEACLALALKTHDHWTPARNEDGAGACNSPRRIGRFETCNCQMVERRCVQLGPYQPESCREHDRDRTPKPQEEIRRHNPLRLAVQWAGWPGHSLEISTIICGSQGTTFLLGNRHHRSRVWFRARLSPSPRANPLRRDHRAAPPRSVRDQYRWGPPNHWSSWRAADPLDSRAV
jgi:hypothetical protein